MKIKYITISAAVIGVLLGSVTASADFNGTVTADALNVRVEPTTDSTVLGQLPNGTNVTITGQTSNWYIINYNGAPAYICSDYITANPNVQTAEAPSGLSANISEPSDTATIPSDVPSYDGLQSPGEMLVELAKQYVGTPYVYGGMSPEGFDCSGLVKYCYSLMSIDINRVACDQAKNGIEVARADIKPGDILCFESSVGSGYIGHTGIYVGNGYFIHSPREGYNVEIIPLTSGSFSERLVNIRRIFN